MNEHSEPVLSELRQSIEIGKLRFRCWGGAMKPVSKVRFAMYAKRRTDRVAIFTFFKTILTRETSMPSLRPPHLTGIPIRRATL